jgi:predicted house-cleaning NTP pyrophosphatase (Maf/HAM1 superfamily)
MTSNEKIVIVATAVVVIGVVKIRKHRKEALAKKQLAKTRERVLENLSTFIDTFNPDKSAEEKRNNIEFWNIINNNR